MNNTGTNYPVKEAFSRYILKGIDEFMPLTKPLEKFIQRERSKRLFVCPSRMIDDVQKMIDAYRRAENDTGVAIDSPLPAIFLAFAKESGPIPMDRGRSVAEFQETALADGSTKHYKYRMQMKSWRGQLVFMAHEQETLTAMTDMLRMYIQRFLNHRWPVDWHHDGLDFQTKCTFEQGFEPEDMVIEVDGGRKNIMIYAWDFNLNFIVPFVGNEANTVTNVQVNTLSWD